MGKASANAPSKQSRNCDLCGKLYSTAYALKRHVQSQHRSVSDTATVAPPTSPVLVTTDGRPLEITRADALGPGDQVEWPSDNGPLIRSVTAVPRVPGVMTWVELDNVYTAELGARTPVRRVIA